MATIVMNGKFQRIDTYSEGTNRYWMVFGDDTVGVTMTEEDMNKLIQELKKHKESNYEK